MELPMCFSATASFTASALLVPVGLYCLKAVRQVEKPYWLLAVIPLLFGIQQFLEGNLWLAVATDDVMAQRYYALSFMFFSHFFWLFWVPLLCYALEDVEWRKRVFLTLAVIGAMFGASMYWPVLVNESWLEVVVIKHAITYDARLIYDDVMPLIIPRVVYAFIVIMPLLMSSEKTLRVFGRVIATTVIATAWLFSHAYVSTWCFFAAIASLYVLYVFLPRRYQATINP
jgi:hypothetical protein